VKDVLTFLGNLSRGAAAGTEAPSSLTLFGEKMRGKHNRVEKVTCSVGLMDSAIPSLTPTIGVPSHLFTTTHLFYSPTLPKL